MREGGLSKIVSQEDARPHVLPCYLHGSLDE
jgi:hypothetical protein